MCVLSCWVCMCVLFSKQCGVAQSHTGLGLLCTLLCISSQEDMVFVPEHFNVYLETMARNKRREAERERDNEVSKLRESIPHTMELTWILWKAPGVNSFAVLVCVRAAGAFTQLWWFVYSVSFWCGGCCLHCKRRRPGFEEGSRTSTLTCHWNEFGK